MLNEIQQNNNNCMPSYQQQPIKPLTKGAIPIAPAPHKINPPPPQTTSNGGDLLRCRTNKKTNYKQGYVGGYQSASIIRRNARERNRVKQVNDGFAALRRHLPPDVVAALSNNANRRGASKKLSKVDTLRMVVEYIRYLQQLLDDDDDDDKCENQENNVYDQNNSYILDQTPPSSVISSSSPAPSFSSDASTPHQGYTAMSGCFPIEKYESHHHHHHQINPMDEELLDVISWWQQK